MERQQYEKQHWENIASEKDFKKHISDRVVTIPKCMKAIGDVFKNKKHIMEIGSGVGRLIVPMAKKMPKAKFHGVEISKGMIEKAEKLSRGLKNIKYYETDGRHLPKVAIDGCYSMTTFQHITREGVEGYINQVGELMKKGGVFRFQFVEGVEQTEFSQQYSLGEIQVFLKKAGFLITKIDKGLIYDCWTWITADKK